MKIKIKRKIIAILICGVLLVNCSQKNENNNISKNNSESKNGEEKDKTASNEKEEYLKKITYSNLVDKAAQSEVENVLKGAGISEKNIKSFFEGVNYFNNTVQNKSLVKEGFKITEELNPVYDQVAIQESWTKKSPVFIGQNCRITSFELMRDFISVGKPEIKDTEQLFMDEDALKNFPVKIFTDNEKKQFESLFSAIKTENTKDISVHVEKVKEDWKKKNIKFNNRNKISLVSVFFHSEITPKESFLFIGHVGVLLPTSDGKLLFIEKLAFQEPYQAIKFDNRTQLNDYLMNKYDVEFNQPNARPFIMENNELMKGYRLNPNNVQK
jgi:membrane associated protein